MDSVSLLWCSKRSHGGVLVVLVAVEVEHIGTITARLDLKSPAAPPSPTTDTLSLFNYGECLRCVVTSEGETNRNFLTMRIPPDFSSEFWRAVGD
jgi:hypothetical protein